MQFKIPIPHFYLGITNDYPRKRRKELFADYVREYIEQNFPEFRYITIKDMFAICERRA